MELIGKPIMAEAKTVIKNKFWIVEENGKKIGTIQQAPDGVVFVQGTQRKKFPTFKILSSKTNICLTKNPKRSNRKTNEIYEFPCDSHPYNPIYDLKSRLPLYTKEKNSKSHYCAGYYAVEANGNITEHFCPKKILLSRNTFHGPFKSKKDLSEMIRQFRSAR